MDWQLWFVEHSVELISLLVTLIGLSLANIYLFRINNKQWINQVNSPNSPIIQAGRDVTSSDLSSFKKDSKKDMAFSEEIVQNNDVPKEQIQKIEIYLNEDKKISLVAEMSLRLAKELKMPEDEAWLEREIQGFKEYKQRKGEGLQMVKSSEGFEYRKVEAELHIMAKGGHTEEIKVPMFFSQSLRQIEDWVQRFSKENKIIMNAPPMQLMVKELKVNPNKDVPYLINPSSLNRILNEVRLRIIDFLERAKKKI